MNSLLKIHYFILTIFVFISPLIKLNAQNAIFNENDLELSLDSIQLVESLYNQIKDLKLQVDHILLENKIVWEDLRYTEYKESRLNYRSLFREIIDNIETKTTIVDNNGDILENYSHIARKKKSNSGLIILEIDTLFDPGGIGHRLYHKDPILKTLYPRVYRKILFRSLRLEFRDPKTEESVHQTQVIPLQFPTLSLTSNNHAAKQELASKYAEFLWETTPKFFVVDLINGYFELEKKQIIDNNIDKIIELRRKFIEYLRQYYDRKR